MKDDANWYENGDQLSEREPNAICTFHSIFCTIIQQNKTAGGLAKLLKRGAWASQTPHLTTTVPLSLTTNTPPPASTGTQCGQLPPIGRFPPF